MLKERQTCLSTVRLFVVMGMTTAMFGFAGLSTANGQSAAAGYHITICHRTGSASNPYIMISPDVEGVINGHLDHEQTGNGLGGDIIPNFTYKGVSYSKNLSANFGDGIDGAAVLANGCKVPKYRKPTPSPTPPTGPTPPPTEPVPEPMTLILFGTGLAAVGAAARRKFGKKTKADDERIDENV